MDLAGAQDDAALEPQRRCSTSAAPIRGDATPALDPRLPRQLARASRSAVAASNTARIIPRGRSPGRSRADSAGGRFLWTHPAPAIAEDEEKAEAEGQLAHELEPDAEGTRPGIRVPDAVADAKLSAAAASPPSGI